MENIVDNIADKPIESEERDLLGRAFFSSKLGEAIYEFDGKDGLVIGLFGKWGTGKTSVVNMALSKISKLAENDKNGPIIIKFAPWNYSDKNNLISLFFNNLEQEIHAQGNREFKRKVGKALRDYSGALDALSFIPGVGPGLAKIVVPLARSKGDRMMQAANLDETREKLEKALKEAKRKIVVVIDDIDRLTNSQIKDIFQLVKQVADFPYVMYILVMDRDVVCSALSEIHNLDGEEYIEKIIQVPFELPEIRKTKLHKIFSSKLEQVAENLEYDIVLDRNYWNEVFTNCIEPYIKNLRDINRVLNVFRFKFGALRQETSFEDMVALTTLEVLEPQLYKWIANNKEVLCDGSTHSILLRSTNAEEYRKKYNDQFEELGIDPKLAINCVATIFPSFAKDVNEREFYYNSMSDLRSKMRVAHRNKFDTYFALDLEDIKVPKEIIKNFIYFLNKDKLKELIEENNKDDSIMYLLEEIDSMVDEIPYERIEPIVLSLLGLQTVDTDEGGTIFDYSPSYMVQRIVNKLLMKLQTEGERFEIIWYALENAGNNELGVIASIILKIKYAYGSLAESSERKDGQIISLEQLEELEKLYIEKIRSIKNIDSISNINNFISLCYLLESIDNDETKEFLDKIFISKITKLKFVCKMANKWSGINFSGYPVSGWNFNQNYPRYITRDEVYNEIMDLDRNELNEFNETEQIQLASFTLNYEKDDEVSEQEALERLQNWKTVK